MESVVNQRFLRWSTLFPAVAVVAVVAVAAATVAAAAVVAAVDVDVVAVVATAAGLHLVVCTSSDGGCRRDTDCFNSSIYSCFCTAPYGSSGTRS